MVIAIELTPEEKELLVQVCLTAETKFRANAILSYKNEKRWLEQAMELHELWRRIDEMGKVE